MVGRWLRRPPTAGVVLLGVILVACTSTSSNADEVPTTLSIPPLPPSTSGPAPATADIELVTGLLSALYGVFLAGDYGAAVIGLDPALVEACGGVAGLRAAQHVVRDGEGRAWSLDGVEGAERTPTGMRVRVRASVVSAAGDVVLRSDQGGTVELRTQVGAPYGWVVVSELVPLGLADSCGRSPSPEATGGEPTEGSGADGAGAPTEGPDDTTAETGPGATSPTDEPPEPAPPETTPVPETTAVPETTVPETTVPETTVPETTAVPTTTVAPGTTAPPAT